MIEQARKEIRNRYAREAAVLKRLLLWQLIFSKEQLE
jgi:hypothetical protein